MKKTQNIEILFANVKPFGLFFSVNLRQYV